MRDYCMELAMIATGIAADVLGPNITASTAYSTDKNNIIITFDNYPLYNQSKTGKVFVVFPSSSLYVRRGNINYNDIQQSQCRYYQQDLNTAFAHPHVYNDGHPCWDKGARNRITDFISNIVETLTLTNVTLDSVTVGLCASGVMGIKKEALDNAHKQRQRVISALGCNPIVNDHRKLEAYITKRWRTKTTIFTRSL